MASSKVTDYTEMTAPTSGDVLYIVNVGSSADRKIKAKELINSTLLALPSATAVISSGAVLYGNSSGELTELAVGTTGQFLGLTTGVLSWNTPASSYIPVTMTAGGLLYGAGGVQSTLTIGASGYTLQSTGGVPTWKSPVRYVGVQVIGSTVTLTTGNDKARLHIPPDLNGYNLSYVHAMVNATSAESTTMSFMVHNLTDTADMLTSAVEIDGGEKGSDTASSAAVINGAADDVATNDILRFDIDVVGSTAASGLVMTLGFSLP